MSLLAAFLWHSPAGAGETILVDGRELHIEEVSAHDKAMLQAIGLFRLAVWEDETKVNREKFKQLDESDRLPRNQTRIWIVRDGDAIVATSRVTVHGSLKGDPDADLFKKARIQSPTAVVERQVVARPYRRRGLNLRLSEIGIAAAIEMGARSMVVTASPSNAQLFEHRLGFVNTQQKRHFASRPEIEFVGLWKDLIATPSPSTPSYDLIPAGPRGLVGTRVHLQGGDATEIDLDQLRLDFQSFTLGLQRGLATLQSFHAELNPLFKAENWWTHSKPKEWLLPLGWQLDINPQLLFDTIFQTQHALTAYATELPQSIEDLDRGVLLRIAVNRIYFTLARVLRAVEDIKNETNSKKQSHIIEITKMDRDMDWYNYWYERWNGIGQLVKSAHSFSRMVRVLDPEFHKRQRVFLRSMPEDIDIAGESPLLCALENTQYIPNDERWIVVKNGIGTTRAFDMPDADKTEREFLIQMTGSPNKKISDLASLCLWFIEFQPAAAAPVREEERCGPAMVKKIRGTVQKKVAGKS